MANQITIEVSKEVIERLQSLSFAIQSRSEIITNIIEAHKNDPDASILTSPVFLEYSNQLASLKAELELARIQLQKDYVPEEIYGKVNYSWTLDIFSTELNILVLPEQQETLPENTIEEVPAPQM